MHVVELQLYSSRHLNLRHTQCTVEPVLGDHPPEVEGLHSIEQVVYYAGEF